MILDARGEPLIPLKASDRLFATGRTGSGKTTMCKVLLRRVQRFVVFDPKHTFWMRGVDVHMGVYDPSKNRQIIRLPRGTPHSMWDSLIGTIYDDGDIIIYIDEVSAVTPRLQLPPNLDWAVRTGRERNVGVWSATQYPTFIPSNLYSETDHFLLFRLSMKQHRQKVIDMTGDVVEKAYQKIKGEHDFIYYHQTGKITVIHERQTAPQVRREELQIA